MLGHNYVVLGIDSTDPISSFEAIPVCFLSHARDVKMEIGNFGSSGQWEDLFYMLEDAYQSDLSIPAKHRSGRRSRAVETWSLTLTSSTYIGRLQDLNNVVDRSRREWNTQSVITTADQKETIMDTSTGVCGHDLWFGDNLRLMKVLKIVEVVLSPRTTKYG